MENMNDVATLIGSYGVAIVFFLNVMWLVIKYTPKIIEAYKEGNKELVAAVTKVADSISIRLDKLEAKVDDLDDKVDELDVKVDNLGNRKE